MDVKARDVFAAALGRFGPGRNLIVAGALALGLLALPAVAAADCPNEAIREAQHATLLPECRAWEKVSPADKNGGEVYAQGNNAIAATDGNALSFVSHSVFGNAVSSGNAGVSSYVARRSSGGWSTHGITPVPQPYALQLLFPNTLIEAFSDDLSTAFVKAYDLPGAADDTPDRVNYYLEDSESRALRSVTVSQLGEGDPFQYDPLDFLEAPYVRGASADLRHVALDTQAQLLPENTAPGYPNGSFNVYTWDDGVLHLAGILPNGEVSPEGSTAPGNAAVGQEDGAANYRDAMSADGSRQIFRSPAFGNRQLYLRIDNTRTAWISEPEGSDQSEPQNVQFNGMTPDGKTVYFVTDSALLDEDQAPGPDLYRWTDGPDPANEDNLTLITNNGRANNDPIGFGIALVGMSDDGEIVYFNWGNGFLGVWDHGVRREIAEVTELADPKLSLGLASADPGLARVSPDGKWLAFITPRGGDLHLYNLENDEIMCGSCPAGGGAAAAVEIKPNFSGQSIYDFAGARPRYLSDDGKVFFATKAALLPEDANGVFDVYEFDGRTGSLHLISSGRGSEPSMFVDASRNGDDVFIATRGKLTSGDRDGGMDLYDARVGGGFAEAAEVDRACGEESCQGAAAASPGLLSAASAALHGAGNQRPRRRCGPNRRRVTRHGKTRCVKKHRKHQHNRRAAR